MSEAVKSKYTIVDTPGGFLVQREGGYELGITYGETYIWVGSRPVGLYCFPQMVDAIANYFLDAQITRYIRKAHRAEAVAMIARALSRRIKPHWQRIINEIVPQPVSELARLMWSSVHGDAVILHCPELYTESYKHLRSDLKKYHACRLIAKKDAENMWPDNDTLLTRAALWRTLYSENAVSPKAFNKTLDKLPRAISFHAVRQLANTHLAEPITSRLHLIAVLCGADHFHWYMHEALLLRASEAMVKEASVLVGYPLKAQSKTIHIRDTVQFILDYPAPFNGDFLGLARRSLEWHRENYITPKTRSLPVQTRLPLLDLDYDHLEDEGVSPLRTVGDVVTEGDIMHHCVSSYALRASQGYSFLFHVEHNGEWATVELDAGGRVNQAYGPRNVINSACKWGTEMLTNALVNRPVKIVRGAG